MLNFSKNISVIQEDGEIIDCLVDNQAMPKDLSASQTISFFEDQNFHIVLFLTENAHKSLMMMVVRDFAENIEDLLTLSEYFRLKINEGKFINPMKSAKDKVDNIIYMTDTFRALFGKKDPENDPDFF
ncbi:hypothetical protein SAMN04515674_105236 [Pseudarcicella hirudinis]|uniref:Uncharacterized protein n=1 Tax=Pseudarcicella hirudinis TaxID=1079859 RepID=A0A1I5SX69_9BACT|nr:hypothetical protein [Pseudarcicella hirudinis]SFP74826.1 hypothetical protein SAMN04515674_105236 [Pseudarcicella hirudinis]